MWTLHGSGIIRKLFQLEKDLKKVLSDEMLAIRKSYRYATIALPLSYHYATIALPLRVIKKTLEL